MNVIDYCKWRGDISFKESPFNYNDSFLLSELAYCNFEGLIEANNSISIGDLAKCYFKDINRLKEVNSSFVLSDTPTFLKAIADTKRFSNCRVYNYVSKLNAKNVEQFAAMMVDLSDHTTVVVFRGTDDTMIGWKEDFTIAYKDLPSQYDAVNYLNKYMKFYKKYRIIGHSKGGNLALYASINCKPYLQNRIIQVISNDGPGIRSDAYDEQKYLKIRNRFVKIVPQFDVVGQIYDMDQKTYIVKANGTGFAQHSIINWQVAPNNPEYVGDYDENSKLVKMVIENFLEKTSLEERKAFIEELFDNLSDAGIKLVDDFSIDNLSKIITVIKKLSKISKKSKNTINILLYEIVNAFRKKKIFGITISD